jgi:hypothetical protein
MEDEMQVALLVLTLTIASLGGSRSARAEFNCFQTREGFAFPTVFGEQAPEEADGHMDTGSNLLSLSSLGNPGAAREARVCGEP